MSSPDEPNQPTGAADEPVIPAAHPYRAALEAERQGWYELVRLVGLLNEDERLTPGYYRDPAWAVRDVVGHLGTWMAQAEVMLEQWYDLAMPSEEAAWWIRKSGAEHYAEHLDRLQEWAQELVARREPEG